MANFANYGNLESILTGYANTINGKANKSELPDVATASEVGLVKPDGTTIAVDANGVLTAVGGGSSSDPYDGRKTRYTISSLNWSSSPNSSGYYTYSLTLTNPLTTATSPNVYIAGSGDNTEPTATEKTMFGYVKRCNLSSSTTLVLYATTKPTSTFYVFVGAEGGSGIGRNLLHTYTISKTDFGEVDASGRRAATVNAPTLITDLLSKNLYVEVYENNYFGYWKKYNIVTGAYIFKGYFEQNNYNALAMYGDPSKYYSVVIENNYTVPSLNPQIIIRIIDSYYTDSMPSDSQIVINIYEIA